LIRHRVWSDAAWVSANRPATVEERDEVSPDESSRLDAETTGGDEGSVPVPKVSPGESWPGTRPPRAAEQGADRLTAQVAAKLREARKRLGISLDQLAERTGVSGTVLRQIEIRQVIPSIGVLWKIASGLQLPFADLVSDNPPAPPVLRRADARVMRSGDGKFESRPLVRASSDSPFEVYELLLAAHSRHTSEAHGAGTRELVVVLSGALRMAVGDETHNLAAGDSILFDANQTHVYQNPGGSYARYYDLISYSLQRP
jgi:XRE family transcriptional regulator, regulator of sulfur utilization